MLSAANATWARAWPASVLGQRVLAIRCDEVLVLSAPPGVSVPEVGAAWRRVRASGLEWRLASVHIGTPRVRPFAFIHPGRPVPGLPGWMTRLAEGHGPILYAELAAADAAGYLDLERTLVHESLHLFGQSEVLAEEPPVAGFGASARDVLQGLTTSQPEARTSVAEDLCVARDLMERVSGGHADTEVRNEVGRLVTSLVERDRRFATGPAERFWAWIEGTALYADQHALLRSSWGPVVAEFGDWCNRGPGPGTPFYPMVIGAALAHASDRLAPKAEWQAHAAFVRGGDDRWFEWLGREAVR